MKIAIVGAGVSGLVAARLLARRHDVELFEAGSYLGGHANTVDCEAWGRTWSVDTGFMVFNRRTYPHFCRLLEELGIAAQPSDMSFSVSCGTSGLEYQGSSLNGLFAQRSNLLSGRFYRMLGDIVRFNRQALAWLDAPQDDLTVADYLTRGGYGEAFRRQYLLPMTSAIWSTRPAEMGAFPARFLLEFLRNHGLLQLRDRPQWLTLRGGSRTYVQAIAQSLTGRIRLNAAVHSVTRDDQGVELRWGDDRRERFDAAVLALHADDALRALTDADPLERRLLGAFPYQSNEAVLHTDESLLPRRRAAWASWNYHLATPDGDEASAPSAAVTYDLTRLQRIAAPGRLLVTLNRSEAIAPSRVLGRFHYRHPAYTLESLSAQRQWDLLNGRRNTYYCGAYWRYGFHEDGAYSGVRVAQRLGVDEDLCTVASTEESCGTVG